MAITSDKWQHWFLSRTLSVKMRFLLGVLGAFALAIGVVSWFGLSRISADSASYAAHSNEMLTITEIGADISQAELHARGFLASGRTSELEAASRSIREAQDDFNGLRASADKDGSTAMAEIDALGRDLDAYAVGIASLNIARQNGATAVADGAGERLTARIAALKDRIESSRTAIGEEGMDVLFWIKVTIAVLGLLALADMFAAFYWARSDITRPLEEMTGLMIKLADGNNDINVPGTDRADEIGDMARSLEVFRRGYVKLERMRAEAAEAAEAERQRLLREEEEREAMRLGRIKLFADLADKFEKTVGEVVGGVAAASTQLQVTATSMAATAEQSAMQTADVSSALAEASAGVTAAAAASDEFAMSIGEISRQAATSAELARVASASAASADSTISALNESAAQVGQIVELISSIAQRTNLLALNASIEAARGGEAGRGFAVVASEVKELAAQTSKATDAVAQQIRAIQESTTASVAALKSIGQQIEQLEATSISIAAAVDQQSIAGQDLARSIDLAARSTDDVSSNIAHVRESTLATGAAASQVLSSSNELEHQAATLKAQVAEFLGHVRAA